MTACRQKSITNEEIKINDYILSKIDNKQRN